MLEPPAGTSPPGVDEASHYDDVGLTTRGLGRRRDVQAFFGLWSKRHYFVTLV